MYFCTMSPQRIPKAITLVGLATTMTGLTFKLNHLMGAPIIFNIGIAILVIGLVLWAFGLIQKK
jgi:Flp pilus assembly protein protease CpaA